MNCYLFKVWKDFDNNIKEVLVVANDLEEAEDKLSILSFDDYCFEEEVYYDDVIV